VGFSSGRGPSSSVFVTSSPIRLIGVSDGGSNAGSPSRGPSRRRRVDLPGGGEISMGPQTISTSLQGMGRVAGLSRGSNPTLRGAFSARPNQIDISVLIKTGFPSSVFQAETLRPVQRRSR